MQIGCPPLTRGVSFSATGAGNDGGRDGRKFKNTGDGRGVGMRDYNAKNKENARELRTNMTIWERILWYEFLRAYPVRFQRQKMIGKYIADFYCAKAQLILELDGSEHYEDVQKEKDQQRTAYFNRIGIEVIRFSNRDVDQNFRGVCETIDFAVKKKYRP